MLTGKKEQKIKWVTFVCMTISKAGIVGTFMTQVGQLFIL